MSNSYSEKAHPSSIYTRFNTRYVIPLFGYTDTLFEWSHMKIIKLEFPIFWYETFFLCWKQVYCCLTFVCVYIFLHVIFFYAIRCAGDGFFSVFFKGFVGFPVCICWQVCPGLIRRWTNDILYIKLTVPHYRLWTQQRTLWASLQNQLNHLKVKVDTCSRNLFQVPIYVISVKFQW